MSTAVRYVYGAQLSECTQADCDQWAQQMPQQSYRLVLVMGPAV